MHKHQITYENYNGEKKTKDLYFNLSEAELTKLQKEYLHVGGIGAVMQAAIDSEDTRQLLDFFELLVHKSYGIKSPDGELFDKSPEIMRNFENSAFYSDLYMSFFQDEARVGQEFIRSVMPAALIRRAEQNVAGDPESHGVQPSARERFAQHQQGQTEQNRNLFNEQQSYPQQGNVVQHDVQQVPQTYPVQESPQNLQDFRQPATRSEATEQGYINRPPHEQNNGYPQQ